MQKTKKKIKLHGWQDVKDRHLSPERQEASRRWVEKETLEMNLRALRELTGKTQTEMAELAEMTQGELSKTERREDHLLSTIRRYVTALGGELEVLAVFDDKKVRLKGI
jgi:hypothetical protein